MYNTFKRKIYLLLDPTQGVSKTERVINYFLIVLIALNIVAVIFETVDSTYQSYKILFDSFEIFSISIFSIEYLLRLWTCTIEDRYRKPITGRLKFMISISSIIDLVAILPFYLPFFIKYDFRFVRILRLTRFFRFFKISRYVNASKSISRVFESKKDELILSMVLTFFLIVLASSLMYFVEHDAQPNQFSSIPATMWWTVATLTTVGYGDMHPITSYGKTITAFISILGIGLFALPAGILASGFAEEFQRHKKVKKVCQHCGEEI